MRHRARITFRKHGDLRFIGQRDLVRVFERMLRRTGVGLALSQGFHPKAKLSFPLALAVGIEGAAELLEVEFSDPIEVDLIAEQLKQQAPPGLDVLNVDEVPEGEKKLQPISVEYRIPIPSEVQPAAAHAIREFLARDSLEITRPGKDKPIDARAQIEALQVVDGQLHIVQRITRTASAQPREILGILDLTHLEEEQGAWLTRTAVHFDQKHQGDSLKEPSTAKESDRT